MAENKLVKWIVTREKGQSMRAISRKVGMSHAYVTNVLQGNVPISWNFAARVAETMGLDYVEAFEMAGLIDPSNGGGDQGGGAPASPGVTIISLPQRVDAVTNGDRRAA